MAKVRFWYQSKGKCPHCSKPIEIKVRRVVTKKAISAEIDLRLLLEKDTQKKLK